MPASENGNAELVKKILARKDKNKEVKESEESPALKAQQPKAQLLDEPEVKPSTQKQTRFNPVQVDERMDDVADLGNLTAAELRKSSIGESIVP